MSDKKHDSREDLAIEQAWNQVMATGHEPRLLQGGEAADPQTVREYTELLGMLPYELTPQTPPAHLKEALMARVAGDGAGEVEHAEASEAAEPSPVVPFKRPAFEGDAGVAPLTAPVQRPFWRYAQAAVLAASLVGLGFLSATVRQQNQQIALLSQQAQASVVQQEELLRVRDRSQVLEDRLNMVTRVARYAYPMRTASTAPEQGSEQKPEGIVYVCGMHQQWYLSLRGLEPPAEGGEYRLWFMTEEGKIDGGTLDVNPGNPAERADRNMPKGTQGFLVTLETPEEPEGLEILLGETPVNL